MSKKEKVCVTTDYSNAFKNITMIESEEWNKLWARARPSCMFPPIDFSNMIDSENATQPRHYKHGDKYEVIKVLEAWGVDKCFYLGNVIKYVARAGKKDPAKEIEDLEKAKVYLEMKINKLKP